MAQPMSEEEMRNIVMENLQMNSMKFSRFQTVLYIVGGVMCGILGLTDLLGLLFYLALSAVIALFIVVKMKFNTKLYANSTPMSILIQGASSHALSFVLFWTMTYALVYIY
jgi:ER membrane protein complex subunit 6